MLTDRHDEEGKTHEEFHALTSAIRTKAHVRRGIIEAVIVVVLAVGGGLLMWGGTFATNMVHDQLADQRITFPEKGTPGFDAKAFPSLQQYAGQAVDNGPKAKAYANEYIAVHLQESGGGKTYAELSTASRANPDDAKLVAQVQTAFRGETLRGLLLYAWGWSVVAHIASLAAWAAFALAGVVLAALLYSVVRPQHS
jgi:hypothetical protein